VLLFVEDHLAMIQDLDAVKAYDLASTVDPPSTIGIDAAWHFCSLTLDWFTNPCESGGFGWGSSGSSNRRKFRETNSATKMRWTSTPGGGKS
jgi:hypothetical protein